MNKLERLCYLIEEADAKEFYHRNTNGKLGLADKYRQDKEVLSEAKDAWVRVHNGGRIQAEQVEV